MGRHLQFLPEVGRVLNLATFELAAAGTGGCLTRTVLLYDTNLY